jgi:hypothetical protein
MTLYKAQSLMRQIFLLVAGAVAVIVYFKQLKAMRASLQQTLIMQRRELYSSMTNSLPLNNGP